MNAHFFSLPTTKSEIGRWGLGERGRLGAPATPNLRHKTAVVSSLACRCRKAGI